MIALRGYYQTIANFKKEENFLFLMYPQHFKLKDSEFFITNFGEYYFPNKSLRKNLEEIILFSEDSKKHNIPNGSVFVYKKSSDYNPRILKTDVGCGITAYLMESLDFDENNRRKTFEEILKVVTEINMHIGQGNHFLDFTTTHPSLRTKNEETMFVFLHSDFNNEKYLPVSFEEAKDLESRAKERRIEFLERLSSRLGLHGEFYNDWTHNSINIEDNHIIYRKGAINLKESNGIGLLALNPVEGLYLYVAEYEDFYNSMQHGVGKKPKTTNQIAKYDSVFQMYSYGIARGFSPKDLTEMQKETIRSKYKNIDDFIDNFGFEQKQIGYCVPYFVVKTKGYATKKPFNLL